MGPFSRAVPKVLPHLASTCRRLFDTGQGWALNQAGLGSSFGPFFPPGSVEVAIAVLLGTCIVVMVAILRYCFFKSQRKSFHRHHHPHPPPPTPTSSKVSTTEDMEHLVYYQTTRPL